MLFFCLMMFLQWTAISFAFSLKGLEGKPLVSVKECLDVYNNCGNDDGVSWIDASWWHKGDLNGRALFEKGPRIPGSIHMDMDDIAARNDLFPELNPKDLPHMLPPPELFEAAMDAFGIQQSDHIFIYGRETCYFTPRTYFLFRYMGHDPAKIHLMQGSLEEWIQMGGEIDATETIVPTAHDILNNKNDKNNYQATISENVCNMQDILNDLGEDDNAIILDPRGSSFVKGHIPGAFHVPYSQIVTPDNTLKFKSKEELQSLFETAGIDDVTGEKKIICSCGSGVSVCHLFLALELCGRDNTNTYLYDGSWAEWGKDPDTPKVSSS